MRFNGIPTEMRLYAQWCVWRYEDGENGAKPTKVPYSAKTGTLASVTNPQTWSTYEEAVNAATQTNWYAGIGFILSENDPYTIIDLDDPWQKNPDGTFKHDNPQEVLDRQLYVFNNFPTYAERSPSGTGLHLILKGKVPVGRRRSAIEIYCKERYMTMTGEVYRSADILPLQDTLEALYSQMGASPNGAQVFHGDDIEKEPDEVILKRAMDAANGDKFKALHEGRWSDHYPSQSEADFAYVDIVAFYTHNRNQITRLFLSSALGKRDKAKRTDYINYMLGRCFDRIPMKIDFDGLKNAHEERIAEMRAAPVIPPPAETEGRQVYTFPPGIVGTLAAFLYEAAPRPVPEIALAGAIGFLSGICGRCYNISGTGLNQYVLLLAPTGTGKEAISSGVDKIMNAVIRVVPAITEFVGPAEISSAQALIKYLSKTAPSFVSIIGEFGLMLSQMSNDFAPSHQQSLKRILLDLYNKSGNGQTLRPMIYSDKEKNTNTVDSPAVTLLGESTPESFYGSLNEEMIANGLLPRIMTIEYYGKRPALNKAAKNAQPNFQLCEAVASLASHALQLNSQNKVIDVRMTPDAEEMLDAFETHATANINSADKEVRRHLWNRAHLKALKLAALVAVGISPYTPTIDINCADWAIRIVVADIRNLLGRFDAGEIGIDNDETRQLKRVIEVMKEWTDKPWSELESLKFGSLALHSERIIPYGFIQNKTQRMKEFKKDRQGATNALKRTLKTFEERGDIQQVGRTELASKFQTTASCYVVKNLNLLK
jgi:hypothetical protein